MGLWVSVFVVVVVVVVVGGGAQVLQHDSLTDGSLQSRLAHPVLLSPKSQPKKGHSKVIIYL